MIPIVIESEDLYQNLKIYEHCVFCLDPTNTWHTKTNMPVCTPCSKTNKVSDIPKEYSKEYMESYKNRLPYKKEKIIKSKKTIKK